MEGAREDCLAVAERTYSASILPSRYRLNSLLFGIETMVKPIGGGT